MGFTQKDVPAKEAPSRREHMLAALGLLVVLFASHGWSLGDGVFFDDYWHRAALRDRGWSFNELIESATVDLSGHLNDLWWQERTMVWRYARPVAMFFMKIEYYLTGGNPAGIHLCAILWHGLTALLVYRLAVWAGIRAQWAFVAGTMFILSPHSVFSVGWTAARNALVSGFFCIAAVLAYASASFSAGRHPLPRRLLRFALPVLLWALALLSRETAIIFPLIILVLDLSFGGWRHLRSRLPFHLIIWVLALVFLYWRLVAFSVEEAPHIYFHRVGGVAYLPWAASKLVNLLFSLVFYCPMLMGMATYKGLSSQHLLAHAVIAMMVGAIAVWYVLASRGQRGRWLWPIWVLAAFLPVVPIFAMPHFAYLPAAAYSIMAAIILSSLPRRPRAVVTTLVIAATVWSLAVYRWMWQGIVRSEQVIYADIQMPEPPPEPGSRVFFINLPIAGIYAPLALRTAWGVSDLEGSTLTFAPHPLVMNLPSVVEQLNDHELVVSTSAPGYFSGISGRMLLDGTRPGSPLARGTVVKGDPFDTTILEGDEAGIRKLKFSFHKPLADSHYYFYVSSPERPAYRLRFDARPAAMHEEHAELFARAGSQDPQTRTRAREEIVRLAHPLAVQTASPIQADLADPQLRSDEALARVQDWWRSVGASDLLRETQRWRQEHASMLAQRDFFFRIVGTAEGILRSDLYLTGGPKKPPPAN